MEVIPVLTLQPLLRQLLDRVDLNGLLLQADALHANRPSSFTSSSVAPTSCRRQSSA